MHMQRAQHTQHIVRIVTNNDNETNVNKMSKIDDIDDATYMKRFRATKRDIANDNAKYCTFDACASNMNDERIMLRHDAFSRDNAQRDSLCVWCKRDERIYNRAYAHALRACNVRTRREINMIDDVDERNAKNEMFDEIMTNVRSRRYTKHVS